MSPLRNSFCVPCCTPVCEALAQPAFDISVALGIGLLRFHDMKHIIAMGGRETGFYEIGLGVRRETGFYEIGLGVRRETGFYEIGLQLW